MIKTIASFSSLLFITVLSELRFFFSITSLSIFSYNVCQNDTHNFRVPVPAAGLELGLPLQGGPVPVQGVPHLTLPAHNNILYIVHYTVYNVHVQCAMYNVLYSTCTVCNLLYMYSVQGTVHVLCTMFVHVQRTMYIVRPQN